MKKRSPVLTAFLLGVVLLLSVPMPIIAQEPDGCNHGECPDVAGVGLQGTEVEGLGSYRKYTVRGGYVADGTGMRNRGYGTISLQGIPAGATIYKAFLYWAILDYQQASRHQSGTFAGHGITGTYIGSDHDPCWLSSTASAYSYRADVTSYVTGNGNYQLTNFASGQTDGADPWSSSAPPMIEGASLVVIFEKSWYPWTTIAIWDGAASTPRTAATVWITIGGFTATDPVGPAYTTFIGADGQDSSEPASTFNGHAVPEADWDGTDPQVGGNYSLGNLWDTDTASVGRYIDPGDTSAQIEVSGSPDCLLWVAQILAVSPGGTRDTDGDALLDSWEANGYDYNGDGVVDVDLPAMGASPWHKDIFVEHDWMSGDHNHQPSWTVLGNVAGAFANAPVANPDGVRGIRLYSDRGQAGGGNEVPHSTYVTWSTSCTSSDIWAGFDAIKSSNFAAARQDIFHYLIWAHDICPPLAGVSGIARGIPSSDFLVTLGSWPSYGTTEARTGTFMHELGHNLGLTHGGAAADHVNYKPNHVSIMNYSFQVIGIWRDGARRWDYTRMIFYALNENNLNETTGLDGSASLTSYGTRWYCEGSHATRDDNTADTNVDWNCNGSYQAAVAADINQSNSREVLGQVDHQWSAIIYNGGTIGAGVAAAATLSAEDSTLYPCMRYDQVPPAGGSK